MTRISVLNTDRVGSGKSTLATSLVDKFNVRVVKTRELILSMTKSKNERADLQAAGNRLDAKTKGKWVADAVARYAEQFDDDVEVLVDSVRIPNKLTRSATSSASALSMFT